MTTDTPALDLDAIRRLVNRATGGPWSLIERQDGERRILTVVAEDHGDTHDYAMVAEVPMDPDDDVNDWRNDAEFIAAARTLVPAQADEIVRLRAQIAFYEGPQKQPGRVSLVPAEQRKPLYAAYKAAHDWAEKNGSDHTDDAMIQAAVKAYRTELIVQAKQAASGAGGAR
jgi:hypothetical protein